MGVLTRFSNPKVNNTFDGRGIRSGAAIVYAATINMGKPERKAHKHFYDFATLTGAATINFDDVTNFEEGDQIIMQIPADATGRTVTWGTNVRAAVASTFVLGASAQGLVNAIFMNAKVHIISQTSGAL